MFTLNYLLSDILPTVSNTPTSPESFPMSSSTSALVAYSSLPVVPLLKELSPVHAACCPGTEVNGLVLFCALF